MKLCVGATHHTVEAILRSVQNTTVQCSALVTCCVSPTLCRHDYQCSLSALGVRACTRTLSLLRLVLSSITANANVTTAAAAVTTVTTGRGRNISAVTYVRHTHTSVPTLLLSRTLSVARHVLPVGLVHAAASGEQA